MKLIKEIYDKDFGEVKEKVESYKIRKAGRAILFKKGKIALLHVTKLGYHKLPGGGIEEGEEVLEGLKREILEETGCEAKIKEDVGVIIEFRDKVGLTQFSYCYVAEVIKEGKPNLDRFEIKEGYELEWFDPLKARNILDSEKTDIYKGKFILKRDLAFLDYYIENLN